MMGEAIGESLPFAVGIAISPIPIIAVILMLVTPRARSNGTAFVVGWLIGLAAVGALGLAIAGPADASDAGSPATWVSLLQLALGLLLVLVAIKQLRGRPCGHADAPMPKWMGGFDSLTPARALGLGVVVAAVNPKNLILAIGGVAAIAQTGITGNEEVIAYAVFTVIASIGVAIPVIMFFALGDRAAEVLGRLKDWMGHNNAVIMAVVCFLIGIKLVGDAIGPLTS